MIRILAVDDERPITELLRLSLGRAGYSCVCAYDGIEAANLIEKEPFDLILLDIMLPGIDGFELMDYIRTTGIPVIFLTAKNAVSDRVKGLRMGAEDYIVKPFDVLELLARVDVVLRRYNKVDCVLEIGGLTIDTRSMQVKRDGEEIPLTKKEYDLLHHLITSRGVVFSREELMQKVWNYEYFGDMRTVDVTVRRLREKIEDDPGKPALIMTKRGVGYYFAE